MWNLLIFTNHQTSHSRYRVKRWASNKTKIPRGWLLKCYKHTDNCPLVNPQNTHISYILTQAAKPDISCSTVPSGGSMRSHASLHINGCMVPLLPLARVLVWGTRGLFGHTWVTSLILCFRLGVFPLWETLCWQIFLYKREEKDELQTAKKGQSFILNCVIMCCSTRHLYFIK